MCLLCGYLLPFPPLVHCDLRLLLPAKDSITAFLPSESILQECLLNKERLGEEEGAISSVSDGRRDNSKPKRGDEDCKLAISRVLYLCKIAGVSTFLTAIIAPILDICLAF